jgi:hypothetical protein
MNAQFVKQLGINTKGATRSVNPFPASGASRSRELGDQQSVADGEQR